MEIKRCITCQGEFRVRFSRSLQKYCSRRCVKWGNQTGEKNPNWKGGITDERRRARVKAYVGKFPERKRAHAAVGRALKDGRLEKPESCQVCGCVGKVDAHHADYYRPLVVSWVCRKCHAKEHEWQRPRGTSAF